MKYPDFILFHLCERRLAMDFIQRFFKGFVIGSGAILPGISSGVLCVIFGIYQSMIEAILGIFKDFKKNFCFLFPLGIGGVIGMVLFGNVLLYLFEHYPIYIKFSFIGLILGSIPGFLQSIQQEGGKKRSYPLLTILAFCLALFLVYLEKYDLLATSEITSPSSFYLFFSGIIMSIGIVVPGVSSTVLLMLLGVYSTYLSAVSSLTLSVLIPMSLGVLVGGLIFLNLLKYFMKHYYSQTFYAVLGFTLGSIFVIYPCFACDLSHFLALGLMFVSIYLTYSLTQKDTISS